MTLIIPVGASGSGKSTLYYKLNLKNCAIVCMDDIRKELTGDISDQSRNKEVADIAKRQIYEYADQNMDVYISATNLSISIIRSNIDQAYKTGNLESVKIIFLSDSKDPDLLIKRVQSDISNGLDRSNTPEDVIYSMSERYCNLVNNMDETIPLITDGYYNIKFKFETL